MGHALWYGSLRCVGHGQREKKEMSMCLSCGCDAPNDRHGDDRHITQDDVEKAAAAAKVTPLAAAQNIMKGLQQAGSAQK